MSVKTTAEFTCDKCGHGFEVDGQWFKYGDDDYDFLPFVSVDDVCPECGHDELTIT